MATFTIPHDACYRVWTTPDTDADEVSILIDGEVVKTSPLVGVLIDHTLDLAKDAVVSTNPRGRHLMVFELPDNTNPLAAGTTVFDSAATPPAGPGPTASGDAQDNSSG